ncbi:hypothetical protein HHL08_08225 [Sphingobium sp. AR-3-1]|uniref:Uncharacterized protein n=1 Tax=Sphingobium psychrophilum TaxID=2728834 RepID=A0A7X9WUF9_9SPHN|nr:hypothetical protein [Sphingobium psychrophilum]NML10141.1 hypothetical protein [Sphingobium psychrophilum]
MRSARLHPGRTNGLRKATNDMKSGGCDERFGMRAGKLPQRCRKRRSVQPTSANYVANAPVVAARVRISPSRKQSFVEISIMQQAMKKQPVGRRSCPNTVSRKLNGNFMPQNYARCMSDRRKVQLLCVTLVGMIAFGVYKIGLALSTGILETKLARASWLDNPAGFVLYLAVFVVGTAAFCA